MGDAKILLNEIFAIDMRLVMLRDERKHLVEEREKLVEEMTRLASRPGGKKSSILCCATCGGPATHNEGGERLSCDTCCQNSNARVM